MLSQIIKNVKNSLQPLMDNLKPKISNNTFEMENISRVVSTVPDENVKIPSMHKEGQFIVTSKLEEYCSDPYLLFEWIPAEGYYSRFSKRNFSSSNDYTEVDISSEIPNSTEGQYIKLPTNFWQIFRTTTFWITEIKIKWTDWRNDIGYIIIKDMDLIEKKFQFHEGGLRLVDRALSSNKFRRITSSSQQYKVVYKINKKHDDEDSIIILDNRDYMFSSATRAVDVVTYESFFNEHGQMEDIFNFKRLTFHFGLDSNIRKEAWKFLLGFYTYSSTPEERFSLSEVSKTNYQNLNEERCIKKIKTTARLSLEKTNPLHEMLTNVEIPIEKDVSRTDRCNSYYSGTENKNLQCLKQILLNYCYTRPHIGYTQGMTDLLAPLLQVLDCEHEAFWCFIEFIENIYCAIFPNNENMDHVIIAFQELANFLLPDLFSLVKQHDCEILLIFTHRWFLLCFQREFHSRDVLKIWEACWSNQYCSPGYYQFFIALSIIYCYHEATDDGNSIFRSSTDEVLIFFSQNDSYDCDAILRCSQILLNLFRNSEKIPCSLRCFLLFKIGGGWDNSAYLSIHCTCRPKKKSCLFKRVSISDHMNNLTSLARTRIKIESVRAEFLKSYCTEGDNVVFER
uniref:TBC1 domain family member 16 (Trinotate prediction) n=1 Tax=Myxobolus squamalis TaxID=59785 RepID=A0A6B2G2S4_MYXSQ